MDVADTLRLAAGSERQLLRTLTDFRQRSHPWGVPRVWCAPGMEMDTQSESGAVLKTHVVVWTFVLGSRALRSRTWGALSDALVRRLGGLRNGLSIPNRDSQVNRKRRIFMHVRCFPAFAVACWV